MNEILSSYQIRKCEDPDCGLRYPYVDDYTFGMRCPRCGGVTLAVTSKERHGDKNSDSFTPPGRRVAALLDNIRSAWNVGSMFRSADGAGIYQMHLCGITPTPEYPGVAKTALGAEKSITWTWNADSIITAQLLREEGCQLWALEDDNRSEPISKMTEQDYGTPVVLIVGNEVCGVDPGLLELCEKVFYIPMLGAKRSLNAAVAFGIAAHYIAWSNSL